MVGGGVASQAAVRQHQHRGRAAASCQQQLVRRRTLLQLQLLLLRLRRARQTRRFRWVDVNCWLAAVERHRPLEQQAPPTLPHGHGHRRRVVRNRAFIFLLVMGLLFRPSFLTALCRFSDVSKSNSRKDRNTAVINKRIIGDCFFQSI